MNIQANEFDKIYRQTLNLTKSTKDFIIKFPEGNLEASLIFHDSMPNSAILMFDFSKKSQSEKEYFEKLTFTYRWFLKSCKIGESEKKNLIFIFKEDNYHYAFKVSVNNLKLLNNRDFGVKDMTAFNDNGGMVYPVKIILKKGKFLEIGSFTHNKKITSRYSDFLNDYSIAMSETAIESFYKHKKMK
jgi:hypothetical protein